MTDDEAKTRAVEDVMWALSEARNNVDPPDVTVVVMRMLLDQLNVHRATDPLAARLRRGLTDD